ncbi:helix-turn-helix domain-containing protein [Streptomyces sp. NPDC001255]|uniref:helix-turn-helix domain-containing protein n=1 Tax=Streptomyces sp. NPDC001255 TaxID=3364550 RepID=UPI0036BF2436
MTPSLAAFLRARRDALTPRAAGLTPAPGPRRVPGLRREELADLAGISHDYYTRLEQGRDRRPSPEILDALARALRLDAPTTRHLHHLAGHLPRPEPACTELPAGLAELLTVWRDIPAVVQTATLDVLAATPPATALAPFYRPGANLLRAAFLTPEVHRLYADAPTLVARAVATLRAQADHTPDDPRVLALRDELLSRSAGFRAMWQRYEVNPPPVGELTLTHPVVGPLTLTYQRFAVPAHPGILLVVHSAEPGSPSERALDRLLADTGTPTPPRRA